MIEEQFVFDGMEVSQKQEEAALAPTTTRTRGAYKPDTLAIYAESGYPEFIAKIAAIGQEARQKGKDAQAMYEGLMKYVKLCQQEQKPLGWQAAYMAMGINRKIAYDIMHGRQTWNKDKVEVVSLAQQLCSVNLEAMMASNTINTLTGIFWQKVHDGFDEESEANAFMSERVHSDGKSADDIANKYLDLPD